MPGKDVLKSWRDGIREFNRGRPWHAHEAWERGWNRLPEPHRTRIQALIQGAAVQVLLEKGRIEAARRLARSALEKWDRVRAHARVAPRVSIPGLDLWLESVAHSESDPRQSLQRSRKLRARLILPRRLPSSCVK